MNTFQGSVLNALRYLHASRGVRHPHKMFIYPWRKILFVERVPEINFRRAKIDFRHAFNIKFFSRRRRGENPTAAKGARYLPTFLLIMAMSIAAACQHAAPASGSLYEGQTLDLQKPLTTIAFGSCNRSNNDQQIWSAILANDPELWIWLGDIVYADTKDMAKMRAEYLRQKQHPEYRRLREAMPIVGIWDDHDYGVNDGDKTFSKKKESQQVMLDFLDVPPDAPVRRQAGAYQSFTFGPAGKQVKIILLDGRFFRDKLKSAIPLSGKRYEPNLTGDVLGKRQWQWLEEELRSSDAQVHIIGCGIQFLAEEQQFEKWANFPAARQRLLNLLDAVNPPGLLLISGDRHIAELSKVVLPASGKPVYDLTSSGLTHTWSLGSAPEPNAHRVGEMVIARNFGIIRIDWSGPSPTLSLEIRDLENQVRLQHRIGN